MNADLHNRELVSALFDGECTAEEIDALLDEMDRAPELKAQWDRLSQVRAARDNVPVGRLDADFSSRVMASLAGVGFDEVEATPAVVSANPKVVQFPQRAPETVAERGRMPRKSRQPLFAMAAAASLAMVAVVTYFEKPAPVVSGPANAFTGNGQGDMKAASNAAAEGSGLLAAAYRPNASSSSVMSLHLAGRDDESTINQSFDDYLVAHEASRMRFKQSNLHLADYQLSAQR